MANGFELVEMSMFVRRQVSAQKVDSRFSAEFMTIRIGRARWRRIAVSDIIAGGAYVPIASEGLAAL